MASSEQARVLSLRYARPVARFLVERHWLVKIAICCAIAVYIGLMSLVIDLDLVHVPMVLVWGTTLVVLLTIVAMVKLNGADLFSVEVVWLLALFYFHFATLFMPLEVVNRRIGITGRDVLLVSLGVCAGAAGVLLGRNKKEIAVRKVATGVEDWVIPPFHVGTALMVVGWALFLVFLMWWGPGRFFAKYGYEFMKEEGLMPKFYSLANALWPLGIGLLRLAQLHWKEREVPRRWLATVVSAPVWLIYLVLGDRDRLISLLVPWFWPRHIRKPYSARTQVTLIVAGLILVGALGVLRIAGIGGINKALSLTSILRAGGHIRACSITFHEVPEREEHLYGLSYFYAVVSRSIPLIGRWLVPHDAPLSARAPAVWATLRGSGLLVPQDLHARGIGWGFSQIAEAYLNFGTIGIVVMLFAAGVLMARIHVWLKRYVNGLWEILLLFAASRLWYATRQDLDSAIGFSVFQALVVAGVALIATRAKRTSVRRVVAPVDNGAEAQRHTDRAPRP